MTLSLVRPADGFDVGHANQAALLNVHPVDERNAQLLDQVRLAVGVRQDPRDDALLELEEAANGTLDQFLGILAGERLDLDLLEKVVPGASFAGPVLLDR